ncbi:cysteine hydrolase [Pseudovibrio exalbescens]|uniref:cysteine hydrolase n=1 Tax=Pseudovibrio exalbescens TaxID=197461 RepID=UPI0015E075C0|nr:cysteine hydrolase [Pseudovibrio exalbescens]
MIIALAGVLVVLAIALWFVFTIRALRRLQAPTQGAPITLATRPNTALVLVDFQRDFLEEAHNSPWSSDEVKRAAASLRQLTTFARAQGWTIINVRHVYKGWYTNRMVHLLGDGCGAEDSTGLDVDPRFDVGADAEFIKHRSDAFSSSAFNQYLEDRSIGTLVLAGLDGNLCVKNTAQGGLNRGYRIYFCEEAVLARNANEWWETRRRYKKKGVKAFSVPVPELA